MSTRAYLRRGLACAGELGKVDAAFCRIESAWIDAADRVAAELYDERCPAFLEYFYHSRWSRPHGQDSLVQLGSKSSTAHATGEPTRTDGEP